MKKTLDKEIKKYKMSYYRSPDKLMELELTDKKHQEIYSKLHNNFSQLLHNQELIIKMSHEHPSGIFKDITKYSYLGLNWIYHLSYACIIVYCFKSLIIIGLPINFLSFATNILEAFALLALIPIIYFSVFLLPFTWYINHKNKRISDYYSILEKYEYCFDTDSTLSKYNYNYNNQETNKNNLFDDIIAMLKRLYQRMFEFITTLFY